jgi:hypothetical protein
MVIFSPAASAWFANSAIEAASTAPVRVLIAGLL